MKRKLLILAFIAIGLAAASSFIFTVIVARVSSSFGYVQNLQFGLRNDIVTIEGFRSHSPNYFPSPATWQCGMWRSELRDTPNLRTGGLDFEWTNDGAHTVRQVEFPLWPALVILAAMIFMGRRRVNRGAFPVGAPTT
jgi:hypothetical protein